jgi:hypothetical protein
MSRRGLVYTLAEYAELVAGMELPQVVPFDAGTPTLPPVLALPPVLVEARRQSRFWPYRSRTEQRYALLLGQWQETGQVLRWRYEAMRLRLAPRTTLTVDFWLTMPPALADPRMQLHEVKGGFDVRQEESLVKLKQAAALYPEYRFFKVHYGDQQWHWREVPAA